MQLANDRDLLKHIRSAVEASRTAKVRPFAPVSSIYPTDNPAHRAQGGLFDVEHWTAQHVLSMQAMAEVRLVEEQAVGAPRRMHIVLGTA